MAFKIINFECKMLTRLRWQYLPNLNCDGDGFDFVVTIGCSTSRWASDGVYV